jgi:hypothetical protein
MDTNPNQPVPQSPSAPVGEPVSPIPPVPTSNLPADQEVPPAMPPSEPPAAQIVHHGPNPALILGIIVLLVLGATAAAFALMIRSKPAEPVQTLVQPTTVQPTPTLVIVEDQAAADLESKPIPASEEDITSEIDLLDKTVNDGAESKFSETTLQGIEE